MGSDPPCASRSGTCFDSPNRCRAADLPDPPYLLAPVSCSSGRWKAGLEVHYRATTDALTAQHEHMFQVAHGAAHNVVNVANCCSSSWPTCHIGLMCELKNRATRFNRAGTYNGDTLFEHATTYYSFGDNHSHTIRMDAVPVNFDYVQYSRLDGRPYFQDPKYPLWIQFVENGEWVSIHVLCIKQYVF